MKTSQAIYTRVIRKSATRQAAIAAALLATLLFVDTAAAQDQHRLVYTRAYAAGSAYQVQADSQTTSTQDRLINDRPIESIDSSRSVAITSLGEVLEVNQDQAIHAIALQITSFQGEIDGEAVTFEPAQRIVLRKEEDQITITYEDGSDLPEDAAAVIKDLDMFLLGDATDRPTLTAAFASDTPRAVGEDWAGDSVLVARWFSAPGLMTAEPEDIACQGTLVRITSLGTLDAAEVRHDIAIDTFAMPALRTQNIELIESETLITATHRLPLDTSAGGMGHRIEVDMSFSIQARTDDQTVMRSDSQINSSGGVTLTPIQQ